MATSTSFRSSIAMVVTCVFSHSALAQFPSEIPFTATERAWIAAHPTIRLMVDKHYEPADFIDDDGKHAGIAADMLALLATRTGLQFEPVELSPDARLELDPQKRGVDGVALSAMTPKRAEFYLTTTPYLTFPAYIITRRSVDQFMTGADLVGHPVAVVKGYAAEEYLESNYPELTLVRVSDTEEGLRKLSYGEVFAFVSDIPVSTYWHEKEGFTNLKIAGESGYVYRLGVTTRKDWPELQSILQKALDNIPFSERDAVRRKWLNFTYEPLLTSQRFWKPVMWTAIVGLSAIAIVLLWNRSLSKRVHKRTQELQESEALLQNCLDNASDAAMLLRPDGTIARVWTSAGVLFGVPCGQLLKRTAIEIFGTDFEKRVTDAMPNGLHNSEATIVEGERTRHLLIHVVRMQVDDADRLYVCRDVTVRRRLEEEITLKKRLETVGLLAGGVAHDFNNIMQVVLGYTEMAQLETATDDERRGYLDEVKAAGGRARNLVYQLLAFSGQRKIDRRLLDLNVTITGILSLLRQLVGHETRIHFHPSAKPVEVLADSSEIERILINMCINARDAMPQKGTIILRVDRVFVEHTSPIRRECAMLSVEDTGTGMSDAVRSRIFEPYFTTKPVEKGTGLGLAVAYKVVEDHGGTIDVKSELGKGTTFTVYLPLSKTNER